MAVEKGAEPLRQCQNRNEQQITPRCMGFGGAISRTKRRSLSQCSKWSSDCLNCLRGLSVAICRERRISFSFSSPQILITKQILLAAARSVCAEFSACAARQPKGPLSKLAASIDCTDELAVAGGFPSSRRGETLWQQSTSQQGGFRLL